MRAITYSLLLAGMLFIAACAIRVPPTGGPEDRTPPKLLAALPDTFTTNFSAKTIEFEFDEYIQVNDLSNKLVVSPPLEKPPIAKLKGKKLVVELQEDLRPNTTYNFNFGGAIADVNEGTAMSDFSYVVSTGSFIDSLSIKGTVNNAFTGAPEKEVTILLYTENADSLPYKTKPAYFTKSNAAGMFSLNYIAPGSYKIFALKETNNNYLFDSDEELIGFIDTLINPVKAGNVTFRLFQPEKRKQKVMKNEFNPPGKALLLFNRPLKNFKLRYKDNLTDSLFYTPEIGKGKDSVTVWFNKKLPDTLNLIAFDNEPIDTLIFYNTKAARRIVRRGAEKPDTSLTFLPINIKGGKLNRNGGIVFRFNHPVDSIDFSKIKILSGTDAIAYTHTLEPTLKRLLTLNYPFTDETKYRIVFLKGAVRDMFGMKNDSLAIDFTLRPERDYGSLTLNITLPEKGGNYVLQLLNEKGEVLRDMPINQNQKIDFGILEPAVYSYRLIEDTNNNKVWDSGNYLKHIQPEVVFYSSEKPTIRAAWDLDTEWNLNKSGGNGAIKGK